ncbi:MAG: hypothetical protein JWM36_4358 [Hyphomicrobiales bacterium]|nr:hypothetical protein [Hyphomicrobiales bacterium]
MNRLGPATLASLCFLQPAVAQVQPPPANEIAEKYAVAGRVSSFRDFYTLRADCTPIDWVNVSIDEEPRNGRAAVVDRKVPVAPAEPQTLSRQCTGKLVDAKSLTYTPNEGYKGQDQIVVEVINSAGAHRTFTFNIVVR